MYGVFQTVFVMLSCCLSASGSYHHGGVLIEGGFGLCWLGAEGGVTAASHQQGGVCGKHRDTPLICAGSFYLFIFFTAARSERLRWKPKSINAEVIMCTLQQNLHLQR